MEKKADIKAIMARFQANAGSSDESSAPSLKHKTPVNATLSSGPAIPSKKPVLESLSGGTLNLPPKPASYLKSTTKIDTEVPAANKMIPLASRFNNSLEETTNKKPFLERGQTSLKSPEAKWPEVKSPGVKPIPKPPLSTSLSNPRLPGPKPPPAASKPTWLKEESSEGSPGLNPAPPKEPPLPRKPNSSIIKLRQQSESDKPSLPANIETFKNKPESDLNVDAKAPLNPAVPPPKPPTSKKPSLRIPPSASIQNTNIDSEPKRKPLPNVLTSGPAPVKPKRPPKVDLSGFRIAAVIFNDNNVVNKPVPPPPLTLGTNRPELPQSALPSLPPRPLGTIVREESYDDVDAVQINSNLPPPLPPSIGHPSLRPKEEDDDNSGDMYEPLDEEAWDENEKRKEKEEKRQLEAEKKEQKEREKKEQDARKKFKIVGAVEVINQGKARVDHKGSRTELALKRGDYLDIIRVQGNPEGKWLGRKQDGTIGYVKTTSVEIDFNTLKTQAKQGSISSELYDDVDVASSDSSGISGQGVFLPPPPAEDELYNDVIDPDLDVSRPRPRMSVKTFDLLKIFERNRRPDSTKVLPPPSQFAVGESSVDDDLYYDVDAQNMPPPPPISSIPTLRGRGKEEEYDLKKMKKFDKEEKDFRKKFKYDGEIQVLYQVTVSPAAVNKKWSGKELAVKPGEKLDVIVKPVDTKMICRNEEGKFGYVSMSNICMDDGDIYDDIGDDCIYDND
ncbi:FYN-binding protein 1 isoform X2 [Syngnathus scovelli]|uniref:FYN-binding protein 1 isoform X2 n=1 Tax=Syngnathus scovelli TaxID=161590 RepID=UPI00210F3C51|nr:FYN-binding protein 1 isoform X2 [Syngnathus scovelli]